MTNQASQITRVPSEAHTSVFNDSSGALCHILSFVQEAPCSGVSRAFLIANSKRMGQTAVEILRLSGRASIPRQPSQAKDSPLARSSRPEIAQLEAELAAAFDAGLKEVKAEVEALSKRHIQSMQRMDSSRKLALRLFELEYSPRFRLGVIRLVYLLAACRTTIHRVDMFKDLVNRVEQDATIPEVEFRQEHLDRIRANLERLSVFLFQEQITSRFLNTIRANEERGERRISQHFLAMHQGQSEEAVHSAEFTRFADENRASYSCKRFVRQEQLALDARIHRDCNLRCLWVSIAPSLNLNLDQTPTQILDFFNEDAHIPQLDQVGVITMHGALALQPEILRLRHLGSLTCRGTNRVKLTQVPELIRQIPQLTHLRLPNNRIQELPPWLVDLPGLQLIDIRENPLRVLPDEIYRRFEGALFFDRAHLVQIPFRLWFQETFACGGCLGTIFIDLLESVVTFFRDLFGYSRMVEVGQRED